MASKIILLLLSLAVALQWERVEGIRCYECSSSDNKYCADPPDTGSLQPVECGPGSTVCSKEILNIFDKTVVSRWCADENFCRNVDAGIGSCSLCLTDLCNTSSVLKSSSFVVGLLTLAVVRRIFAV
ncbi:uncharacterized protein LOC132262211 [Phlebotomus argentipes]|uniref:uncharacterized protein LOC132262211 n=1 Tax=Phlebotomus argentipes TaxID=94469 RepID=UPI002892E027|nr:uncharacterized protein LOC132262211 [Phlebotomus argentipes]